MVTLVTVLHVIICLFLILVILLQAGKGGGMGAAFGGASTQAVFGGRGAATFLTKMTSGMAMGFILTSIMLAWFASQTEDKRLKARSAQTQKAPVENPLSGAAAPSTQPAANNPAASQPAPAAASLPAAEPKTAEPKTAEPKVVEKAEQKAAPKASQAVEPTEKKAPVRRRRAPAAAPEAEGQEPPQPAAQPDQPSSDSE